MDEIPAGLVPFSLASFEDQAKEIVESARRRAAEILGEARVQAETARDAAGRAGHEAGRAEGFARGRDEGLRAGREEGLTACRAETATLSEAVRSLAAELRARREALIKEAESDLLVLSVRVAERIVRREVGVDENVVSRAVIEAIGTASERSRVTVVLNPADLAAIKAARADMARLFAEVEDFRLEGDTAVSRGGCRVVTGAGEVDMRLETQLDRIEALLSGRGGFTPGGSDRSGRP